VSIYNRYTAGTTYRPKEDKPRHTATATRYIELGQWLRLADTGTAARRIAPTMRLINALRAVPGGLTQTELFLAVYGVAPERRTDRRGTRLDTDAVRALICQYNSSRRPAYAPPGKIERRRVEGEREYRYTFAGEAQL
jgi:hypothetical protein